MALYYGKPCVDCGCILYKDIEGWPQYVECQRCLQSKVKEEVLPYWGMYMTTQIQQLKGYRVVNKATAVIITIIPKINHERFPEREFLHVPIWENE